MLSNHVSSESHFPSPMRQIRDSTADVSNGSRMLARLLGARAGVTHCNVLLVPIDLGEVNEPLT